MTNSNQPQPIPSRFSIPMIFALADGTVRNCMATPVRVGAFSREIFIEGAKRPVFVHPNRLTYRA